MWTDRRLIDLLQIEHPILLSAMAGIGTVNLAAAVCAAGGLGSIGCALMEPEFAAKTIRALRGLTDKPINVNFFCHIQAQTAIDREEGEPLVFILTANKALIRRDDGVRRIEHPIALRFAVNSSVDVRTVT